MSQTSVAPSAIWRQLPSRLVSFVIDLPWPRWLAARVWGCRGWIGAWRDANAAAIRIGRARIDRRRAPLHLADAAYRRRFRALFALRRGEIPHEASQAFRRSA